MVQTVTSRGGGQRMSVRFKAALLHRSCRSSTSHARDNEGRTVHFDSYGYIWFDRVGLERDVRRAREVTGNGWPGRGAGRWGNDDWGTRLRVGIRRRGNAVSSCVGRKHGRKHRGRMTGPTTRRGPLACLLRESCHHDVMDGSCTRKLHRTPTLPFRCSSQDFSSILLFVKLNFGISIT